MVAAETIDHRNDLGRVAGLVEAEVVRLLRPLDTLDVESWWARNAAPVLTVVERGFRVSTQLAARYLIGHGAANGATIDPVAAIPDRDRMAEALRISAVVGFRTTLRISADTDIARRMTTTKTVRSAQRLSLKGSRSTIMSTVADSRAIVGYQRVTRPGACDFCTMLAGRGAVFKSSVSASTVAGSRGRQRGNQRVGHSYHDSCRCTPEPIHA